jgi:hypothetical protein
MHSIQQFEHFGQADMAPIEHFAAVRVVAVNQCALQNEIGDIALAGVEEVELISPARVILEQMKGQERREKLRWICVGWLTGY